MNVNANVSAAAKMKKKKKINKDMKFGEVLEKYPETGEVFVEEGLYCISCPMAAMETIKDGCKAHGIDADKFVKKLNSKVNKK